MTPQLSHTLGEDGRVFVKLKGPTGAQTMAWMEASSVKRFAWGVLNDLDPEELAACYPDKKQPAGKRGDVSVAILKRLARGDCQSMDLTEATGRSSGKLSGILYSLKQSGKIAVRPTGRKGLVYSITDKGREYADEK